MVCVMCGRSKRQGEKAAAAAAEAAATSAAHTSQGTNPTGVGKQPAGKRRRVDTSASAWRKDTQAGFFLVEEDEDFGAAAATGAKAGPATSSHFADLAPEIHNPCYPAHPKCKDCSREFWNSQLQLQFGVMVCDKCQRDHKESKYAMITKTAAKADYLLRESDLSDQPGSLRYIEKKNRKNEMWARIKLYLLCEVEARAFSLYGGEDGLDEEFDKRDTAKKTRY